MLVLVALAIPAGLLGWVLAGERDDGGTDGPRAVPGYAEVGEPAPDFTLRSRDGEVVRLSAQRGTPVVLTFWASWCGPCRKEMPLLQEALEERPGEFVVLAVNWRDFVDEEIEAFLDEVPVGYPTLPDPDGEVAQAYGVVGIPQTLFIDGDGVVRAREYGITSRKALDEPLDALLATP